MSAERDARVLGSRAGNPWKVEHVSNREIARTLEEIADHLDFTGRARFPARAYRRAARSIAQMPVSVGALAMAGRARELRGVGESLEARIVELCETGTIADLERMREHTPPGLMLLTRLRGVSRNVAFGIWETLEPHSLEDVAAAAEDGRLLEVPRVGPKTVDVIRNGVSVLLDEPELVAEPMLRSHALRAAGDVQAALESVVPDLRRVHLGGEFARGDELVRVLDLVVVAGDAAAATAAVRDQLDARGWQTYSEEAQVSDECLTFALQGSSGAGVRLHVTDEANEGRSLLFGIGPVEHAREVCRRADAPAPDGPGGLPIDDVADAALYARAGLAYVPPELRDRPAILDVAQRRELPRLVEVSDLRGELHCHSTWSDGRATIEEMAKAAISRGYDHLAITDHSQSLRIVNGLTHGDLAAQWRELEQVRATLPAGFALLQGTEMEILPDGSLDFPPGVLERLDWVVASIHSRQRQDAEEITRRIEQAMFSPWVDCIGHPTSRLLLKRPKTALDTDRLIELAARTGTFLEINSSPDRLDLDSETAERAAAAGVLLCIDSDAHGPETLGLVAHGVAIARRAGLRPEQVVNARPWGEVRELQKRWRA